ncbi:hypothetical protein C7293_14365 [filamentous cyanobacterium CCT1]|nr:hypothetical protein C7293_14365 [filamentous cyanobacterium CCT1]
MATRSWVSLGNGFWDGTTNWTENVLPGVGDDVVIDVAGDITVTHRQSTPVINSLIAEENLSITSNSLLSIQFQGIINGDFALINGRLVSGGNINLNGDSTWDGGTVSGGGVITNTGVLTVGKNSSTIIENVTLKNAGKVVQSGALSFQLNRSATIQNLVSGDYEIQGDSKLFVGNVGGLVTPDPNSKFDNAGVLSKTGVGTSNVFIALDNSGSVNVQQGELSLRAGGNNTNGSYTLDKETKLTFGGGTHRFNNSNFDGLGVAQVNGGKFEVLVGNTATVDSGFLLSSGELTSGGNINLNGDSTWDGGKVLGGGVITNTGVLTVSKNSSTIIENVTLKNAGKVVQSGALSFQLNRSATIQNLVSGDYEIQGDSKLFVGNVGGLVTPDPNSKFDNAGVLSKTGVGTSNVFIALDNSGSVNVQQGELSLRAGYTQTSGVTTLNGGTLNSSTLFNIKGGALEGFGTINANVKGAGIITPGLGGVDEALAINTLTINGTYTQAETSLMYIELGSNGHDQVNISGKATLGGALVVNLLPDFVPNKDTTFDILKFSSYSGEFSKVELPDISAFGLEFVQDENLFDGIYTLSLREIPPPPPPTPEEPARSRLSESDDIARAEVLLYDRLNVGSEILITSPRADAQQQRATEIIGNNFYKDGSDVDIFGVALREGDTLRIKVESVPRDDDTPLHSAIRIFNRLGQERAGTVDYSDPANPVVEFVAPSSGSFYIGISAKGNESYSPLVADKNAPGSGKVDPRTPNSQGAFQLKLQLSPNPNPSGEKTVLVGAPILGKVALEDQAFAFSLPEGAFYSLSNEVSELSYSASLRNGEPLPEWLSFDAATQTFSGTPTNDEIGFLDIAVKATVAGSEVTQTFILRVNGINDAPTVTREIENKRAPEGQAFNFTLSPYTFKDVDPGDKLTYLATLENGSPLPTWLTFNAATQTFSGTPTSTDAAILSVKVTATDLLGVQISDVFVLRAGNINTPPILENEILDQTTTEGAPFAFVVPANTFEEIDPDDSLTYTATLEDGSVLPAWLTFNPNTLTFNGTPGAGNVGVLRIKVTADDGQDSTSDIFQLNVESTVFTPIQVVGNLTLGSTQLGYAIQAGDGPLLPVTLNGEVATPVGGWQALAVDEGAGGVGFTLYWRNAATQQTATWSLNAQGAFTSSALLTPAQALFAETNLNVDLTGDGQIGLTFTPIQAVGNLTLGSTQLGYAIQTGDGTLLPVNRSIEGMTPHLSPIVGPSDFPTSPVVNNGEVATRPVGWQALAVNQAADGAGFTLYWRNAETQQFLASSLNAQGTLLSTKSLTPAEVLLAEASLRLDLVGDGKIGPFAFQKGTNGVDELIGQPFTVSFGFDGDDTLVSGSAIDSFDILIGGAGSDLYRIVANQTAVILDGGNSPNDVLELKGASAEDVSLSTIDDGRHLVFDVLQNNSRAILLDWRDEVNRINTFRAGETSWSYQEVVDQVNAIGPQDFSWNQLGGPFDDTLAQLGLNSSPAVNTLIQAYLDVNTVGANA